VQRPTARVVLVAVALWSGLGARPSAAAASDPRTEIAREHSQKGDAYYKLEKYSNAIAEYEQAYLAKSDPSFLYNIAQCHRLMKEPAEAIKFYRRYLNDAPAAPNRAVAEKHIRDLEAAGGANPPLAAPALPGPVAAAPAPASPPSAAGAAPVSAVSAVATGQPAAFDLTAPAPKPSPQGVGEIGASPSNAPAAAHPVYTRWWFWTGVGVVVLAGVLIGLASAGHDPSCAAGFECK
jgi:tetratricopeptide (TPR) repeat protein